MASLWLPRRALVLIAGLVALAGPLAAAEFTPAQKTEMGQVIHDYLMANPEVLRDAIAELQSREKDAENAAQSKITGNLSGPLYSPASGTVIGNPNGKVTLVEFFDYNCGYCKHALGDLASLMKNNPDMRVILKDFPILSPGSVEAAQIAIAARNQFKGDKFWEFHQKLLGARGPIGRVQALAVAKDLGADMDRLQRDADKADVRANIAESLDIAKDLALNGTPSYVVGQEVVVGAVGYDELKAKLDNARKCGKATCS